MSPTTVNSLKSPSRDAAGEVVDEHGIIIQPAEGESKTYERTGQGMLGEDYGDGNVHIADASELIDILLGISSSHMVEYVETNVGITLGR